MEIDVDPYQMASTVASWSVFALFSKDDVQAEQDKV